MEREDAEGATWESQDSEEWGGFEPPKAPGEEGSPTPSAGTGPDVAGRQEDSAVDMIPSDVWQEMTGRKGDSGASTEAPSRPPPSEERAPPPGPQPSRSPHEDVPREFPKPPPSPHGDVPRDFPGPPPSPHRGASQRRGERSPAAREGRGSGGEGRGAGQEGRGTSQEGRGPAREPESRPDEVPHVPDERELRRRAMAEERGRVAEGKSRRRRGSSPLGTDLVPRGDPQAFRKAVVYREVLGPPVGFRPGGPGWESEAGGVLLSGGVGRPAKKGAGREKGREG